MYGVHQSMLVHSVGKFAEARNLQLQLKSVHIDGKGQRSTCERTNKTQM